MGTIEYIGVSFLLLLLEAMNNAKYSKQLVYQGSMIQLANKMLALTKDGVDYSGEKVEKWNTEAKFIKTLAIVFALIVYGSWEFAYIYVGMRTVLFSPMHSVFWKGRLQPFKWYFKNSIAVRTYDYIKGWF